MANGTRNVFITQTKNAFLPYIQAFTDYMGQYMQQQGQLAEKMYDFNKQKEGQKFVDVYGSKIREAKTPEELSKITTEAIQYGSSRGLQSQLTVLGALSQGQGNYIKLGQDKERAGLFVDMIKNQLGGTTVNYGGNPMTDTVAAMNDIISKTPDPTTQVTLLEQLVKGLNQNAQSLTKSKSGEYQVSQGVVNPFTKKMVSSGEPVAIGSANGKDFMDINKNKLLDKGEEFLTPDVAQDLMTMRERDKNEREQNARLYGGRNWVTVINKDTQKPESLRMDYEGNLYTANNEPIKDASKYDITNKSALSDKEEKLRLGDIGTEEGKLIDVAQEITEKLELQPSAKAKYLSSSSEGVSTSAKTGKVYMTKERLKQVIGTIKWKKEKGESLSTAEQQFFDSGAYDLYWDKYKPQALLVDEVGKYQSEYVKNVIGYENPNAPKISEPVIVEKNGIYQVYDTDGSVIGTAMTKQAADDIIKKSGKKKENTFNNLKEGY